MIRTLFTATIGFMAIGVWHAPANAQEETDQRFGTVHFATSCNETAQRRFDRAHAIPALVLVSGIEGDMFEEVLKADPDCGIAYWGIATELALQSARSAACGAISRSDSLPSKGEAVGAKTQRERDFIDALAVFYTDYDKATHGRACRLT